VKRQQNRRRTGSGEQQQSVAEARLSTSFAAVVRAILAVISLASLTFVIRRQQAPTKALEKITVTES
jgi:hypothetical protein